MIVIFLKSHLVWGPCHNGFSQFLYAFQKTESQESKCETRLGFEAKASLMQGDDSFGGIYIFVTLRIFYSLSSSPNSVFLFCLSPSLRNCTFFFWERGKGCPLYTLPIN